MSNDLTISDFELLIADNSPTDGSKLSITKLFPKLHWLTMTDNTGFARANNAGIRVATGDAILLLNPDTIVMGDAVVECYDRLMKSTYVAAGVQLLNPDHTPQISGNFVALGGLNLLMQVPYFGRLLGWSAKRLGASSTNLQDAKDTIKEVDWINGAFIMVKRSAIEKAGLLDEDFFLYHEESEWCSRLRNTGKLCIFGGLHVIHLEGQSANKAFGSQTAGYSQLSDRKGYQLMLSMFVRIRKEFGIGWFLFHILCYTLSIPFVLLFAVIESLLNLSLNSLTNSAGFCLNVLKCWQFAGRIFLNKPYFYKVL